jgi:hypothetical protein
MDRLGSAGDTQHQRKPQDLVLYVSSAFCLRSDGSWGADSAHIYMRIISPRIYSSSWLTSSAGANIISHANNASCRRPCNVTGSSGVARHSAASSSLLVRKDWRSKISAACWLRFTGSTQQRRPFTGRRHAELAGRRLRCGQGRAREI